MKGIPFISITNYISLKISFWLSLIIKKPLVWGSPFAISIETYSGCNLLCPQCPTGKGLIHRKKPLMDPIIFDTLIAQIPKASYYCQLFFQGEPLLDKHLEEKIKKLSNKNKYTVVSTNAQLITHERAKSLVASGLSKIIVSMDGASESQYVLYRKNGSLKKTIQAIEFLSKEKKRQKTKHPIIEVQTVVNRHNEIDLREIKNISSQAGANKFSLKSMQIYGSAEIPYWQSTNKRWQRYRQINGQWESIKKRKRACFRIFSTLVISSDGQTAVCCYDKSLEFQIENISHSGIREIWKGPAMTKFRQQMLIKKFPSICYNCND